MSYRLEARESVQEGVRRIAGEQVGKALALLDDASVDAHEKVHETRKRCKKVRGLLRLARPAFEDTYDRENDWYRDAARELSDLRDAQAFLECFDALMDRYEERVDRRRYAAIRATLVERRDALAKAQDVHARLARVRDMLKAGHHRIDDWQLDEEGFAAFAPGAAKTYRRGREAMATAYDDPSGASFHEWRKRSKYHRFHCRLLRELWKPVLSSHRDEAKRLSDLLGDSHDIAALRSVLLDEEARFGCRENLGDLLELLEERRQELRAWARPLGRAVFAEKPKRWNDRLESYWQAWQQAQSLEDEMPARAAKVFS